MAKDFRSNIAKTPQTDPDKFPEYEYKPYPRMMNKDADDDGKIVPHAHPDGRPVIVHTAEEEEEFLASLNKKSKKSDAGEAVADLGAKTKKNKKDK